jgi:hypothetical protein
MSTEEYVVKIFSVPAAATLRGLIFSCLHSLTGELRSVTLMDAIRKMSLTTA